VVDSKRLRWRELLRNKGGEKEGERLVVSGGERDGEEREETPPELVNGWHLKEGGARGGQLIDGKGQNRTLTRKKSLVFHIRLLPEGQLDLAKRNWAARKLWRGERKGGCICGK